MLTNTDDVTDIETARRIIAQLRVQLAEVIKENEPIAGEFTVFLDEDRTDKVELLFNLRKLFDNQDEYWDFGEAFTEFVSGYIDLQYEMVQSDDGFPVLVTSA